MTRVHIQLATLSLLVYSLLMYILFSLWIITHLHVVINLSPCLSTLLLALFIFRWNIDRAVERGVLPDDYSNFYQHQLILEIQELRSKSKREGPSRFPEFPNIHDVKDTLERFILPLTLKHAGEKSDAERDLSPGMEFSALLDGSSLPFTPVLCYESKRIMDHIWEFSTRGGHSQSINHHSQYDFDSAAATWNKLCANELEKPFENCCKMFPKTAVQLWTFHAEYLCKQNANATVCRKPSSWEMSCNPFSEITNQLEWLLDNLSQCHNRNSHQVEVVIVLLYLLKK